MDGNKVRETRATASIPESLFQQLATNPPQRWVVTGCAGFIGSHIVENLLMAGQTVVGIDNFATGSERNLQLILANLSPSDQTRFEFHELDICGDGLDNLFRNAHHVLHQAALGSVPRSVQDPMASIRANVDGFNFVLNAARLNGIKRFVYASSSSVYGDNPDLPKIETKTGQVLSPYAATKSANELFAGVFSRSYGIETVGLRYFNVFGARQDPAGAYAAVIPRWIIELLNGTTPKINGDGTNSRDFCYVANAVQANILSALTSTLPAIHSVFNIACEGRTDLTQLFDLIVKNIRSLDPSVSSFVTNTRPIYGEARKGDIPHSLANIAAARQSLGYLPEYDIEQGMKETVRWYLENR
jgi:UDP-N-acetylglucosamine/UDP-N-acetylgalactosamine 4-epimerase